MMIVNPYRFGAAATDPNFANVVLLCGFEGADGSTSFVDESPVARTLTASGSAQVDTAQFKFGAASLLVDNTNNAYVSAADSADWDFGSGQFTIEGFVRLTTGQATEWCLVSQWAGSSTNAAWALSQSGTSLSFSFFDTGGTQRTVSTSFTPTANQWYHIAVDRDGSGVVRLYIDGAFGAKSTLGQAIRNSTSVLRIGSVEGFGSLGLGGHVDEVRITKGVARYASDSGLTVPTAAYPRA